MGIFRKKKKRPRSVPSLQEREAQRAASRPPEPEIKLTQRKGPFDPNMPTVFVAKDTIYTVYRDKVKNWTWLKLAVTFVVILLGGLGSAAFQARNANIQTEINRAERSLREFQNENFTLEQQLQERYTFYEIERIAIERLGMSHPDASQIISIYVPRVGGVTLNTADYALPQHNYFWNDVSNFFTNFFDRIFGGR
jgi:cell division protein FtsL